jgi:acyl-CoA synthetase (AMP-forming)/AMP-acid ligase II
MIYRGENVMLGYAERRDDLSRGDDLCGVLATGDLADIDAEGYYRLIGRRRRFLKIHGNRVNLDEVEQALENRTGEMTAATGDDDCLHVYIPLTLDAESMREALMELFRLHHSCFQIHTVETIPFTAAGKKDYARLAEELNE